MVEPNGLQREGTDEWREYEELLQGLKPRCVQGNVAAEAATHKTKSPRAPRLFLLWRALSRRSRASWATTGQCQGGGTERAVGKYDSFPMDAITERGYFAREVGISAKT